MYSSNLSTFSFSSTITYIFNLCLFYSIWQTQFHLSEAHPNLHHSLSSSTYTTSIVSMPHNYQVRRRHSQWKDHRTIENYFKLMAKGRSNVGKTAAAAATVPVTEVEVAQPITTGGTSKDSRKIRMLSSSFNNEILRRRQLYCYTGFHLQIHLDGTVNGTREDHSYFGILDFKPIMTGLQTFGSPHISIRGVASRKYLCMNKRGKLFGSVSLGKSGECEFIQTMGNNHFDTWRSTKYPKNKKSRKNGKKTSHKKYWYIAIDGKGHTRSGRRSRHTQKSTQFLARSINYSKDPFLPKSIYAAFSSR